MPLYARKTAKNTAAGKLAEWHKASKIKCLRLEGSNFRLGGIAPIAWAVPSFLALNERIFLMCLAVSVAWQKEN